MVEVAGSNPAEPTSVFKLAARIEPEDEHNKNRELCNFDEKLCNFDVADNDESLARIMTDRYIDEDGSERIEQLWEELVPEEGDVEWNEKDDPYMLKVEARFRKALKRQREEEAGEQAKAAQTEHNLSFTRNELDDYVTHRSQGLAKKSSDWINRASQALWDCTHGEISHESMTALRTFTLGKYSSIDSRRKVLGFATAFLKYLGKTHRDPVAYQSYDVFLELPRTVAVKKVTERIVRREDVVEVLRRIDVAAREERITPQKARNYRAHMLLAAYTGLRPSTMQRLTVGQLRAASKEEKPFIHVLAEQQKNRYENFVPLHNTVVTAVKEVLTHDFKETDEDKPFFMFNPFEKWLERQEIPLPHVLDPSRAHWVLSDTRKFTQQFGDSIGWDVNNSKFVMAHGMTGVEWKHYRHLLPEEVYDIYMKSWRDVDLTG